MGSRGDELGTEHDATARRAVLLHIGPEIDDVLPHEHVTPDHPIERAAVENLIAPTRRLERAVAQFRRLVCAFQAFQPLVLPIDKLVDGLDADAKLDEMHGHLPLNAP